MKYVILVGDGMGDEGRPELSGRTLLEAAQTPNMDKLAREGRLGLTRTIPDDKEPGSDTANMSLMGYDPHKYHTGRAPIEAAAMGVELDPDDIAFRCNLVTLNRRGSSVIMADYSAGHIDTPTAAEFIRGLDSQLGDATHRFHPGVSYRHLLVWKNGPLNARTVPPHDRSDQSVDDVLNGGGGLEEVNRLTRASWPILESHPAAAGLKAKGKVPPNSIWLWGQGTKPSFPTYPDRFGLSGVVISAVDLIKGLGVLSGLTPVEVPGATGHLDTNYKGKVAAVLENLRTSDLAFLHVEAPDECGHSGILADKMRAIEDFDARVVGPLLEGLAKLGPHRVLLATDHYTPISCKTHTRHPVPFALWDSEKRGTGSASFNEPAALAAGDMVDSAHTLVEALVEKD